MTNLARFPESANKKEVLDTSNGPLLGSTNKKITDINATNLHQILDQRLSLGYEGRQLARTSAHHHLFSTSKI